MSVGHSKGVCDNSLLWGDIGILSPYPLNAKRVPLPVTTTAVTPTLTKRPPWDSNFAAGARGCAGWFIVHCRAEFLIYGTSDILGYELFAETGRPAHSRCLAATLASIH